MQAQLILDEPAYSQWFKGSPNWADDSSERSETSGLHPIYWQPPEPGPVVAQNLSYVRQASEEAERSIQSSSLTRPGRAMASRLLQALWSDCDRADVSPTDDGGFMFELPNLGGTRDLLFVLPNDGSVLYFTARDLQSGSRWAGIVKDEQNAVAELLAWLERPNAAFPSGGLDLG